MLRPATIHGPSKDTDRINREIGATYIPDHKIWAVAEGSCEQIPEMPDVTFMIGGFPFTLKPQDRVGNTVWKSWSKSFCLKVRFLTSSVLYGTFNLQQKMDFVSDNIQTAVRT